MPEPPLDIARILRALDDEGAEYVVIGGIAVVVHGSDRPTFDLDLVYPRDAENLSRLARAVARLNPRLRGAPEDVPFIWDARTLKAGCNFTLVTDAGSLDLLGDVEGVESFAKLRERSEETDLFGIVVAVASIDDLLAMKRAANRLKDQADILELQRLRQLKTEADPPSPEPG